MASNNRRELTIVLTGDAKGLTGTVKISRDQLQGLGVDLDKAGAKAREAGSATEKAFKSSGASINTARSYLLRFVSATAAISVGRGLVALSDEYANIGARLRLAAGGTVDFAAAQAAAYGVAQRTASSLGTTADLITKLSTSFRSLGADAAKSFEVATGLAEEISKAVALSGASSAAASAALTQLGQGLASGTLRGDELNSVLEQTPRLAQAIAEGMGVTIGQLRGMGMQGLITAKQIVEALSKQRTVIEEEYAQLPLTVGRAWVKLQNAVLSYVGTVDHANGASAGLAVMIGKVADHVDDIARAIVLLGRVVATVYATKLIASGAAWIANLAAQSAAVIANGVVVEGWAAKTAASFSNARKNIGLIGIALNIVGAAVVGWQIGTYIREQFVEARLAAIFFVDGTLTLWEKLKQGTAIAWVSIKAAAVGTINVIREALAGLATAEASLFQKLPGGGGTANQLSELAESLRPTTSAAADLKAEIANITAAADKNIAAIHLTTAAMEDYEVSQKKATAATQGAVDPQDDYAAAIKELLAQMNGTTVAAKDQSKSIEEIAGAYSKLADLQDTLTGKADAVNKAWADSAKTLRDIAAIGATLIEHGVAEAAVHQALAGVLDEATAARDRDIAAARRQMDVSGRLIDQIQQEAHLSSLSERDQAIARAGMAYEQEARQQNLRLTQQQTEAEKRRVEAAAAASFDMQKIAEQQRQIAQEYAGFWENAAGSISKAFGDMITGQTRSWKDFGRNLKSIAQQFVSDVIAQYLRLRILGPLLSGAMGSAAGWLGIAGSMGGSSLSFRPNYAGGGGTIGESPGAVGGGGGGSYNGMLSNINMTRSAYQYATGGGLFGSGTSVGNIANVGVNSSGQAVALNPWAGSQPAGGYIGSSGVSYAGAAGGLAGAYWGSQRGSGGFSTAASTATGAVGGYFAGTAAATAMSSGIAAGMAAIPVIGWIALAAMVLDQVSGGKLFGTKYKTAAINSSMSIGAGGADASLSLYQTRQGALFSGRKTRVKDQAVPPELQAAADALYDGVEKTMLQGAQKLGVDVPAMIEASLDTSVKLNDKGQVRSTEYVVNYLGQTWKEATAEAASQRIGAEALVATVAASAGAVAQTVAQQWRKSAEALLDGAQLMLAAQVDINRGNSLLALGATATLAQVVEFTKTMQADGEKLADTYNRLSQASAQYLQFIGQFEPANNTFGGSLQAIAKQMQANIDQANALAQAAGLQHAREEDLANIHQYAAKQAADAIAQLSAAAQDLVSKLYNITGDTLASVNAQIDKLQGKLQTATQLAIGDNSPLNAKEKLDVALKGLRSGITSADDVLALGRKLYASSADYAGLYAKVQDILQLPGAGQPGTSGIGAALDEYNGLIAKRDQLQSQAAAMARFNDAKTLAQYVADISTTHGIGYGEAASGLGFSLQDLAKDLGVTNLAGYLDNLKLADIPGTTLDASASVVTAIQQLGRDLIQTLTGGPITNATITTATSNGSSDPQVLALLASINQRLANIEGSSSTTASTNQQMVKQGVNDDLRNIVGTRRDGLLNS